MVECEEFAENLAFDLLNKVVDGVAVDECALACVVGMQIEVERETAVLH